MLKSMTGYGRAQLLEGGRTITVEMRSVNNRYLDCNVRCPRMYNYLEELIKAEIKAAGVARGKVDIYVSIEYSGGDTEINLNRDLVRSYLRAFAELRDNYGLQGEASVVDMARMPDVFTVEKIEEDRDKLSLDVISTLKEAMEAFETMRRQEGTSLCEDISSHLELLKVHLAVISERSPQIIREYREKLYAKISEVLEDTSIDESRILLEAAIFSDRTAIDEEIVRLESHFKQMREILSQEAVSGRKLDFLIQEINREINTIGSKTSDIEMTKLVLEMKSELEKIREQVQNIE